MKCSALQTRLLELETPAQPPPPFKAHLARCKACRAWFGRLMQVERNTPLLPVPPSDRKDAFVRMVLAGEVAMPSAPKPITTAVRPSVAGSVHRRESSRHKIALATGLAAGLAIFALGWSALQWQGANSAGPARPTPDPLIANLVKYDLKLASAASPRERVETLAALADDLQGQARGLATAANPDDLNLLAKNYDRVLREGVLTHARSMPRTERAAVLEPLGGQLARAGSELSEQADKVPVERQAALRQMASTAREVSAQLLALVQEGKA